MTSPLPIPTGSMNSVLHRARKRPFRSRVARPPPYKDQRRRTGFSPTRAGPGGSLSGGTFLVVRWSSNDGYVEPLRQGVGIPHGQLLPWLDVSQCSIEDLGRKEQDSLQSFPG